MTIKNPHLVIVTWKVVESQCKFIGQKMQEPHLKENLYLGYI